MSIHICSPKLQKWEVRHYKCPNCGKRKMLVEYFEWYGASVSCLNCGDEWHDGELSPRSFARGWRERAVEQLQKRLTLLALGRSASGAAQ